MLFHKAEAGIQILQKPLLKLQDPDLPFRIHDLVLIRCSLSRVVSSPDAVSCMKPQSPVVSDKRQRHAVRKPIAVVLVRVCSGLDKACLYIVVQRRPVDLKSLDNSPVPDMVFLRNSFSPVLHQGASALKVKYIII